jgi:hypothetical protein
MGNAAFLEPLTRSSPLSGTPPLMMNLSIGYATKSLAYALFNADGL